MKRVLSEKSLYSKITILSIFVIILFALLCIPLYIFNLYEVPLGIILGGTFSALCYFSLNYAEKKDTRLRTNKWLISFTVARFFVFTGILVLFAYLYYSLNIHIFNIFGIAGGYMIPLVIFVILLLLQRKEEKVNDVR